MWQVRVLARSWIGKGPAGTFPAALRAAFAFVASFHVLVPGSTSLQYRTFVRGHATTVWDNGDARICALSLRSCFRMVQFSACFAPAHGCHYSLQLADRLVSSDKSTGWLDRRRPEDSSLARVPPRAIIQQLRLALCITVGLNITFPCSRASPTSNPHVIRMLLPSCRSKRV